jgi:hypothetical protein
MVTLLTLACDSKSDLGDAGGGGNLGTGGTVGSGGSPGTGGAVGSGGNLATGGKMGSGGASGAGGATSDASFAVSCGDSGSAISAAGLPTAARACTQDSDCTIAVAARCCGTDQALGEAAAESSAYASCLVLPAGACSGLGCAKSLGYTTDTGRTTPMNSSTPQPIDLVSVQCLNQLCTTDVINSQDGGWDVAPTDSSDAKADMAYTYDGNGLDACSGAIDTAPFIANASHAMCSDRKNNLTILDCSMVLWQLQGSCSDASYSYTLYGTTVDDVLCSYSDSIAGPRSVSNSPICATLFTPSATSAGNFDLSGYTVTAIPF